MTAPSDDMTADPHATIAALRQQLHERSAELALRNSEYGERIEQQSATIDVLKVMSASPGDTRPVFALIVDRACTFCEADHATVALLDGESLYLQAHTGLTGPNARNYEAGFPRPIDTTTMFGRAILARDAVQTADVWADTGHFYRPGIGWSEVRSIISVPLLRASTPVGAIALAQETWRIFHDAGGPAADLC
jgi:two-component system, NtrC family, sensor kinase